MSPSLGARAGGVGAAHPQSETRGHSPPALGPENRAAPRETHRDRRPRSKARRNSVCRLAQRLRLRRQPRRHDDLRSDRHAALDRSEGTDRQLSRDGDRALNGEGATTSYCRLRPVDGHSLCADMSANTRMRQPVDLAAHHFSRASSRRSRARTDLILRGQPLHTRSAAGAREGAKRPTRPSVCNGGLAGVSNTSHRAGSRCRQANAPTLRNRRPEILRAPLPSGRRAFALPRRRASTE